MSFVLRCAIVAALLQIGFVFFIRSPKALFTHSSGFSAHSVRGFSTHVHRQSPRPRYADLSEHASSLNRAQLKMVDGDPSLDPNDLAASIRQMSLDLDDLSTRVAEHTAATLAEDPIIPVFADRLSANDLAGSVALNPPVDFAAIAPDAASVALHAPQVDVHHVVFFVCAIGMLTSYYWKLMQFHRLQVGDAKAKHRAQRLLEIGIAVQTGEEVIAALREEEENGARTVKVPGPEKVVTVRYPPKRQPVMDKAGYTRPQERRGAAGQGRLVRLPERLVDKAVLSRMEANGIHLGADGVLHVDELENP